LNGSHDSGVSNCEMALHISIYYHNRNIGDLLWKTVDSSGLGQLTEAKDLADLPVVSENGTDVFLLEYQENNPRLDQWIENTTSNAKNPSVFLVFPKISTDQLWKALHLGVKECFALPLKSEEFQTAVNRVLLRNPVKTQAGSATKIISFLGCKGGLGTSFLVANTAYLLSRDHKSPSLLVDLDLYYGQLVHFFDIKPRYSLTDIISHLEELDHSYLQNLVHPYNKFLSLLPGPSHLEEAEAVTSEHLEKILSFLKGMQAFGWILVDAGHRMDEVTLKALELSDNLVLVTAPSVPALANTKKWLELLHLLDLNPLEIWLNGWDKRMALTLPEVSDYLGMEVHDTIPLDVEAVNRSINDGQPLAESDPRHPLCQALRLQVNRLAGDRVTEEGNTRRWGWLRRLGGKA
jgi:pilus assembly protein CpaE